jgi:hypothetical protein
MNNDAKEDETSDTDLYEERSFNTPAFWPIIKVGLKIES